MALLTHFTRNFAIAYSYSERLTQSVEATAPLSLCISRVLPFRATDAKRRGDSLVVALHFKGSSIDDDHRHLGDRHHLGGHHHLCHRHHLGGHHAHYLCDWL